MASPINTPICLLPIEALGIVFSYSDDLTQHRSELVCRQMRDQIVFTVATREFYSTRNYLALLEASLKKEIFPQQKAALSNPSSQNFTSLGSLKSYFFSIQEECVKQLLTLDAEERIDLSLKTPSNSMKNLFFLTFVKREIQQAHQSPNQETKIRMLQEAFKNLFQKGFFIQAIEVAQSIPDPSERKLSLGAIPSMLDSIVKKGLIPLTTDLITAGQIIYHPRLKQNTLTVIYNAFRQKGLWSQALNTIQLMPDENDQRNAYRDLQKTLHKEIRVHETIENIKCIKDPIKRDELLSEFFTLYPDNENAIKIFNSIRTEDFKQEAVLKLANRMKNIYDSLERKRLTLLISDPQIRDRFLFSLVIDVLKESHFEEATEIANLISEAILKTDSMARIEKKKNCKLATSS